MKLLAVGLGKALGIIRIGADEVGIVYKKIGSSLASGKSIALNGEAGYQADILPPGLYTWKWSFLYKIHRVPKIKIRQGEIGLVVAKDGHPMPTGQRLGRVVDCNQFQDARAFLEKGGQKGTQLAILNPGEYRINTELFTVITAANATEHGLKPEQLRVYTVDSDKIGIVTTKDGQPTPSGEIAGPTITGHNKFQDPQKFIDGGGCRGLQEEILPAGDWNLNPKFVEVEQIPLTHIPTGTVGVIVSHVGKTPQTPSNEPVEEGYKGICQDPLYPGQYPINTRVKDVVIVPTHQITLDWSNKLKLDTNYDASLRALKLRSQDGFSFNIEVTQLIRITGENAPKMVSLIGSPDNWESDLVESSYSGVVKYSSIKNLVIRVLEPMVGNYFRISAQNYRALDFHDKRDERQRDAESHIQSELQLYGVKADGTFINEIDLPDELEKILTTRNIIDDQIKLADKKKILAEKEAIIGIQPDLARHQVRRVEEAIRLEILGHEIRIVGGFHNFLAWQRVKQLPQIKLPNVLVNSSGGNVGVLDALMAPMLDSSTNQQPQLNAPKITPPIPPTPPQNLPKLESSPPRCPMVLLLDTSNSMSRDYLDQLLQGLDTFKREIAKNATFKSCVEVTTITFGGSAQIVQSSIKDKEFTTPTLNLGGLAAIGQGLETSLKIIESCKTIYQKGNIQYLTPWIFLITGSTPHDSWQQAAQKVQQAIAQKQLNFIAVGISGANIDILSQITPHNFLLKELKFNPLFYWMANLVKGMPKKHFLSKLAEAIAIIQFSVPQKQAKVLEEQMDKLMVEASKDRPKRRDYSPIVAELRQAATPLGEIGQPILDLIPLITKTLEFS